MAYFQTKNPDLEDFAKEDVGIFDCLLVYFTAIRSILWPFGIFYGYLVSIYPFRYFVPRTIWQPWAVANKLPILSGSSVHRFCAEGKCTKMLTTMSEADS
jgi:hypothetical protein